MGVWQSDVRSCIMPLLPTNLVQEFYIATVFVLGCRGGMQCHYPGHLVYRIRISSMGCNAWDNTQEKWSRGHCEVRTYFFTLGYVLMFKKKAKRRVQSMFRRVQGTYINILGNGISFRLEL